jgi:CDP-diacylglycerol--serine O-phosphatidyltransferase
MWDSGALGNVRRRVERRNGWADAGEGTDVMRALTGADYLSLAALFAAWTGALLLVSGEPNWGILATFVAFGFDKLDGYWARKTGNSSAFGRAIDSYVDAFAYLLSGALVFYFYVAPTRVVGAVVGFALLALGGLRLVRHTAEGFEEASDVQCYHGTTVVHTNAVVLACYVVGRLAPWSGWGWVSAVLVLGSAPLMVSAYRAPKTRLAHASLGAFALVVGGVCLFLELGGPA